MAVWRVVAVIFLCASGLTALGIVADIVLHGRQKMGVMNAVWPITALYFGPIALWPYWRWARPHALAHRHAGEQSAPAAARPASEQAHPQAERRAAVSMPMRRSAVGVGEGSASDAHHGQDQGEHARAMKPPERPFWQTVAIAVTHCGGGCTLGDIIAEWGVYWLGLTLFSISLWPEYIADFTLAYLLGIVFQFFAIVPMRKLQPLPGVWAAIKADTLSLTAFEVGLFAWMAMMRFVLFHPALHPNDPLYWFMMQIGMVIGFATAYPMNWWLVRAGIKERM